MYKKRGKKSTKKKRTGDEVDLITTTDELSRCSKLSLTSSRQVFIFPYTNITKIVFNTYIIIVRGRPKN